ncbi:MAG: hypothetical protein EOM20_05420 [Spartobacteria bacterium]|nr:hypothetical protein [Spartobacteria bacterium]
MKKWTAVIVAGLAAQMSFGVVFEYNFDDEPPAAGNPIGISTYGHELTDRGITKKTSASGKNSAFIVADFTMPKWGAIMITDPNVWDLFGATLSVKVHASHSFEGKQGVVGFKVVDGDGTGYRTAPEDLMVPTATWQTFSQNINQLVPDEEAGEVSGLDLSSIAQVGVIFYDRGDVEKIINFYVDDLKAE